MVAGEEIFLVFMGIMVEILEGEEIIVPSETAIDIAVDRPPHAEGDILPAEIIEIETGIEIEIGIGIEIEIEIDIGVGVGALGEEEVVPHQEEEVPHRDDDIKNKGGKGIEKRVGWRWRGYRNYCFKAIGCG